MVVSNREKVGSGHGGPPPHQRSFRHFPNGITAKTIISSFMMIMSLLQHSETKIIRWLVGFFKWPPNGHTCKLRGLQVT